MTDGASGSVPKLELRCVRKSFGTATALGGVDLVVRSGTIHALVGENGAGKSTLLKLLAGALPLDGGTMHLDGASYRPRSPDDARRMGVAMVYQSFSLCPHLTVAENVLLGAEPARFGFVRRQEIERVAASVLAPIAAGLNPRARVGDLSPAEQQLVEIARALAQKAPTADAGRAGHGILILDEPTSCLAAGDVRRLFEVLHNLRQSGTTIVYVSHFLDEVKAISDAYTVLRDGRTVGTGNTTDANIQAIVAQMVGRTVDTLFPRSARPAGEVVVETVELAGRRKPTSATLTLRRGEVLGIAGLVGAGPPSFSGRCSASMACVAGLSAWVRTLASRLRRGGLRRGLGF